MGSFPYHTKIVSTSSSSVANQLMKKEEGQCFQYRQPCACVRARVCAYVVNGAQVRVCVCLAEGVALSLLFIYFDKKAVLFLSYYKTN